MRILSLAFLLFQASAAHAGPFNIKLCTAALVKMNVVKANTDILKDDKAFCQAAQGTRKAQDTCHSAAAALKIQKAFSDGQASDFLNFCANAKTANLPAENLKALEHAWILIDTSSEQVSHEKGAVRSANGYR